MRNSKAACFKAAIFVIVFIMIMYAFTFAIVPKGNNTRMTMREMYSQKDTIDVVFIGASLSERDINPYIMDKELGVKTFDYAFPSQMFVGTYYTLKELFDYQKPKVVVLTVEQTNFTTKREKPLVYLSTAPYMKSFFNGIQYYFASSALDGSYLDRMFPWRGYHVDSIQELMKNIYGKLDSTYTKYPETGQVEAFANSKSGYIGKGAVKINPSDPKGSINYDNLKGSHDNRNINDIQAKNVEYLKKISELCKANDCKLILLTPPAPVYQVLRVKNYFEFDNEIAKFAKDLNIEYYDYNLINSELFKQKEDYFCDSEHLNSKGAEAFSESLANFLKLREKGEDMNKYFYTPEEYNVAASYVAITWFKATKNGSKVTLTADSIHGTKVTPEYQFVLTDLDTGKEQIIRDYDKNPTLALDSSEHKKYKIRVNARTEGSTINSSPRYYEETISK